MEYQVENFSGEQIAGFIVDKYLNSYCSDHGMFMEAMSREPEEIQDNFTYLVFAWLKGLEEVCFYDLRNEASVLLACDLCSHVTEAPKLHILSGEMEMELGSCDDIHVERVMAGYLTEDSRNGYQGFIRYALKTHRTLQQNLTRFFMEWIRWTKKKTLFIQNASILLDAHPLPYI